MRHAESLGDVARVVDVLAGAAGTGLADGDAVVIELEGDAHDVIALLLQQGRGDGRIDAARHRHHDPGVGGRLVETKGVAGHAPGI